MSTIAQFVQACNQLVVNYGVTTFAIILKEPKTGAPKIVAMKGALADPALRAAAAEHFKLGAVAQALAGSGDCEERARALQEKCTRLENEMASLGGDTSW